MTKNVIVIDERGNEYEATYPKRAKGLVKNGRARFVDENTICLACPPDIGLENRKMSDNTSRYTVDSILESVGLIASNTEYIREALKKLVEIEDSEPLGPCVTIGSAAAKAQAIEDIIVEREETNRQLLAFYSKVYDDLREAGN